MEIFVTILRLFVIAFTFFLSALSSSGVYAGCIIERDDGATYTNDQVSSCSNLYASSHQCGKEEPRPPYCKALDALVSVDWDASTDMAIAPHRGIWGMEIIGRDARTHPMDAAYKINNGNDIAQNSSAAFINAAFAGFRYLEIDLSLAFDATGGPTGISMDGRRWPRISVRVLDF